jgi:predicted DCC family thiol-disulfide oxidoreductase YuxK
MRRLHRWDKRSRLAYLSLHDEQVAKRWPDLSPEDLMQQMCLVTQDGERYYGADAFKYLSTRLSRLWPLSLAMHIPFSMPIWRLVYRLLARQRYWISKRYACADDACQVQPR